MRIRRVHGIRLGRNQFNGLQFGGNIFVQVSRPRRLPDLRRIRTDFMSAREHLIDWSDVFDTAAYEFFGIIRLPAAKAIPR